METRPHRGLAGLIALVLCAASLSHAQPVELLNATASPWLGAPSCSARSCHGSQTPGRSHPVVWGNEHTIWGEQDPHRRAYAVLLAPQGQQIAQRLGLEQPAHRAHQCLGCHAPAALAEPSAAISACVPSAVSEGVGCESCHGAAGKWIAAHTAADWSMLSPEEKLRDYDFRPTKDLAQRAAVCATCHVGSAAGDVNHDLIAAGHPRLAFEFASHLHREPQHWDEKGVNDRQQYPSFEARTWVLGQVVSAKAQLELLAWRAEAAAQQHPDAVWPEFAEYGCYSCHRGLESSGSTPPPGLLGKPVWGTWHFPLLPLVGHAQANIDPRLLGVRAEMNSLRSNPAAAAAAARAAAEQLEIWLRALAADMPDPTQLRQRLVQIAEQGPTLVRGEWDVAAQLYLALVAHQQARLDVQQHITSEDAAIRCLLGATRQDLRSAPGNFRIAPPAPAESKEANFARRLGELHSLLVR